MLDQITVNAHSSIRIGGGTVVYVDPFRLTEEAHDADLILFTHPHYDHSKTRQGTGWPGDNRSRG